MLDSDQELEKSILGAALAPSPRVRALLARLGADDFVTVPRSVAAAVLGHRGPYRYSAAREGRDLDPLVGDLHAHGVVHARGWATSIESWWTAGAWMTTADVDELLEISTRRKAAAVIAEAHAALLAGEPLDDLAGAVADALAGLPRGTELVSR